MVPYLTFAIFALLTSGILIVFALKIFSSQVTLDNATKPTESENSLNTPPPQTKQQKYEKINYGSQNFGLLSKPNNTFLDDKHALFYNFSHFDILAFQELCIPIKRIDKRVPNDLDEFKCVTGSRFGHFFAVGASNIDKTHIKCYGIYFNVNFNFKIDYDQNNKPGEKKDKFVGKKIVSEKFNDSYKGGLIVTGTLFNVYRTAICSVHLLYDKNNGGYANPQNDELVEKILQELLTLNVEYFIVLGDFNIKFSTFKNNLETKWRQLMPSFKINSEVDNLEESLVTCFDKDLLSHPDHILTNFEIESFKTQIKLDADHCCVYGTLLVPVPDDDRKLVVTSNRNHEVKPENF